VGDEGSIRDRVSMRFGRKHAPESPLTSSRFVSI